MKDFKSSNELTQRMIALGTGEIKPQDADDEEMLAEYMAIMEAEGEIAIPGDLPDPIKKPAKQKRVKVKSANEDIYPLNDRQEALYDELEAVVEDYGVFDKGIGPNGAHYVDAEKNPFKEEGMVCSNCAFYVGPRGCELVKGDIDPDAICKFWLIPENLVVVNEEPRKKSLISSSIHRAPKRRRKKYIKRIRKDDAEWQDLTERGIVGIATLPSGGLVSASMGKSGFDEKAIVRFIPRAGDPDTYTNQESARIRSRQVGCVGIRRYTARGGETVWMPCTTHVTYQKLTSQGAYRNQPSVRDGQIRKLVRRELMRQRKKKSLEVKAARRKARSDRLAATLAPKADRISGSSRNPVGSASSISSGADIQMDEATIESLRQKVRDHNKKVHGTGGWKRTSLKALKVVYRRGAGAFSASHRPKMTRGQWAMGRVNAFLTMLEKGRPDNPRYTTDNDLLREDHPWRKRTQGKSLRETTFGEPEEKLLGGRIGKRGRARRFARSVQMNPDAFDGDLDGVVQEGTPFERPAPKIVKKIIDSVRTRKRSKDESVDLGGMMKRLKDPDGGFSASLSTMSDAKSGWAIARNKKGIVVPSSKLFDDKGEATEAGKRILLAYILKNKNDFFGPESKDKKTVLGAWHNPETGMVHFDVTDVFSKRKMTKEQAFEIGKKEAQYSIADLDKVTAAIDSGDWDGAFIDTKGDGGEIMDISSLNDEIERLAKEFGPVDLDREAEIRVDKAEGIHTMKAEPIGSLTKKHGTQRDWWTIKAIEPDRRKSIADFYDEQPELTKENAPKEVIEAYEALASEVEEQYKMLTEELGIKVIFTDKDPYKQFLHMRWDFTRRKRIKIMRTSATGSHPFFTDEQNDMFRAVHDVFGHLATGRGFDRHGEEAAYQAHKTMFSGKAVPALATETRGQNMFLLERGFFGPQKLVLLPEEMQKSLESFLSIQIKEDGKESAEVSLDKAIEDSDNDNAYSKTNSHHVSCGRSLK